MQRMTLTYYPGLAELGSSLILLALEMSSLGYLLYSSSLSSKCFGFYFMFHRWSWMHDYGKDQFFVNDLTADIYHPTT